MGIGLLRTESLYTRGRWLAFSLAARQPPAKHLPASEDRWTEDVRNRHEIRYCHGESTEQQLLRVRSGLPGCVSAGDTLEEVERNINEAIEFHLDGMREDGLEIPEPTTQVGYARTGLTRIA
jgi:hypothetical protein